jgi:hypothetical protein
MSWFVVEPVDNVLDAKIMLSERVASAFVLQHDALIENVRFCIAPGGLDSALGVS